MASTQNAYVSYLRVSTTKQGESGLGLEAQRAAVASYVASVGGAIVAELIEIESGKKNARPVLAQALAICKARGTRLVIAKMDRLARNVHFVSGLMESGVDFVCCDNPHATPLTLHILAAIGEHEAKIISERTKAALQAAKARGVKLGGYRGTGATADGAAKAREARSEAVRDRVRSLLPLIDEARAAGCTSLRDIAKHLNMIGIKAPAGGPFNAMQVSRLLTAADEDRHTALETRSKRSFRQAPGPPSSDFQPAAPLELAAPDHMITGRELAVRIEADCPSLRPR